MKEIEFEETEMTFQEALEVASNYFKNEMYKTGDMKRFCEKHDINEQVFRNLMSNKNNNTKQYKTLLKVLTAQAKDVSLIKKEPIFVMKKPVTK